MPSVTELTELYSNFMLGPRRGDGVCDICFNLTDGYARCYSCARADRRPLELVSPISYSIGGEQLSRALGGYKRLDGDVRRRFEIQLAAVLWRFLAKHEECVARAAGVRAFDIVTTVPSSDRDRDEHHPLPRIAGELAAPTRHRYERLLRRTDVATDLRAFSEQKYAAQRQLQREPVLLIDDTWTTGASAQSAAAALRTAGAGPIAAVVIGRHLNREWRENDRRLARLQRPFDWDRCAYCGPRLSRL